MGHSNLRIHRVVCNLIPVSKTWSLRKRSNRFEMAWLKALTLEAKQRCDIFRRRCVRNGSKWNCWKLQEKIDILWCEEARSYFSKYNFRQNWFSEEYFKPFSDKIWKFRSFFGFDRRNFGCLAGVPNKRFKRSRRTFSARKLFLKTSENFSYFERECFWVVFSKLISTCPEKHLENFFFEEIH